MRLTVDNTKTIVKLVVGSSVHAVITTAISNLVPAETKTQKVQVWVGSKVLTGMAMPSVMRYTDEKFDNVVKYFQTEDPQTDQPTDQ